MNHHNLDYSNEGLDNPKIDIDHSTKLVDFGHYEFDCEAEDYDFDDTPPTIIESFGQNRKIIRSGKVETLLKNEEVEVKLDRKRFVSSLKSLIEEQTGINEQAWKKVAPCLLIY